MTIFRKTQLEIAFEIRYFATDKFYTQMPATSEQTSTIS
jgi:hypothetical protein